MARDPAFQPNLANYEPVQTGGTPAGGFPGGTTSYPPAPNPNLRSPLPPSQQTDVDQLRQFYRVGTPQNRTLPLQPNANPATNAAAQTVAQSVVDNSSPQNISIALTPPKELAVTGSPSGATGDFVLTWKQEPGNTVFAANEPGAAGVWDHTTTFGGSSFDPVNIIDSPYGNNEVAVMFWASDGGSPALTTPWTNWENNAVASVNAQFIPSINDTLTVNMGSGGADYTGLLAWFGSGTAIPTVVQSALNSVTVTGAGTNPVAFPLANTASNQILVCVSGHNATIGSPLLGVSVTDTHGNTYYNVGTATNAFATVADMFLSPSIGASPSNTVTVAFTAGTGSCTVAIFELNGITAATVFPAFQPLQGQFVGPIHLDQTNVNGGVTGLLAHTSIAPTAVTPGSYTSANITVQADGTITAAANGSGGGGVTSLNALTGVLSLTSTGATITITPSGSTINLEAVGGGGGASFGRKVVTTTTYNQITSDIGKALDVQTSSPTTINLAAAGVSTIAYVQSNNTGSSSSTFTLAFATGNTAGNTLFVMARLTSGSGSITCADSKGNPYTIRQNITNSSTQNVFFDSIGCAAGSNTVTITASFSFCEMVIAEYSNIASFDQEAGTTGTSNTGNSGNITTSHASELIVGWCSNETANGLTFTAGSGFTVRDHANGNVALEDQVLASPGTIAASIGFSSSVNWFTGVVAYNPITTGTLFSGFVQNNGTSTVAITPVSGLINGASSVTLASGDGATICTDNSDFTAVL